MECTKISFRTWLSFLLVTTFCVSIQATVKHPMTMKETLPAYAMTEYIYHLNSTACRAELQQFRNGIDRGILWSLRMLDMNGEPSSGFLNGNNVWLGDNLACQFLSDNETMVFSEERTKNNSIYRNPKEEFPPFELHFFAAHIRHSSTKQYHLGFAHEQIITLGLCLPESCTTNELSMLLENTLHNNTLLIGQLYSANFTLIDVTDLRNNGQWLQSGSIILIIFILLVLLSLVVSGTVYDIFLHQKRLRKKKEFLNFENNNTSELKNDTEEKREIDQEQQTVSELKPQNRIGQVLLCFSFFANVKLIFKTTKTSDDLPVFHGFRVLGMLWIILAHSLFYGNYVLGNRPVGVLMSNNFIMQIVSNASLSVDTFFFSSGFLLTYVFLKSQRNNDKVTTLKAKVNQFFVIIFKRYVRITPAFFITILLAILNFSWHEKVSPLPLTERPQVLCKKYWWRNILYIHNFGEWQDMCLTWSWYLSNDLQFFIFGTILLIISSSHVNVALGIGIVTIIASIIANAYTAYDLRFIPTLDAQYDNLSYLYIRPWLRISPFLIGMGTAYLLSTWNYKLHMSKKVLVIGWILGALCNCASLFGITNKDMSLSFAVLYTALCRTVWTIGISWIVVVCCTNNAGTLNKFLSLELWIPLSKLTYCSYLLNPILILSIYLFSNYPLFIDYFTTNCFFIALSVLTYISAIFLTATSELPFQHLLRLFLNSGKRRK